MDREPGWRTRTRMAKYPEIRHLWEATTIPRAAETQAGNRVTRDMKDDCLMTMVMMEGHSYHQRPRPKNSQPLSPPDLRSLTGFSHLLSSSGSQQTRKPRWCNPWSQHPRDTEQGGEERRSVRGWKALVVPDDYLGGSPSIPVLPAWLSHGNRQHTQHKSSLKLLIKNLINPLIQGQSPH
jgi:hypothetical protein